MYRARFLDTRLGLCGAPNCCLVPFGSGVVGAAQAVLLDVAQGRSDNPYVQLPILPYFSAGIYTALPGRY
jgi:hypothetical protein